jgi:leucyl-tRNA synthetase
MWTKFLYDRGWIGHDEPYKRLVNQGMIQGSSRFVYRLDGFIPIDDDNKVLRLKSHKGVFVSYGIYTKLISEPTDETANLKLKLWELADIKGIDYNSIGTLVIGAIHVDVNIVDGLVLDINKFKEWRSGEYANAEFILEDGKYICGTEVEKMSKSKFNTVNPDDLVWNYGADTFRMYEMFLGPVEMSKPWDTKGIEGVHRFLKKLWRLFYDEIKGKVWTEEKATDAELKVLHKTIKQIEEVTERFSFNTGVSGFMIAVNELTDLKCHKKEILEKILILLIPYAPHIAEELWSQLGNTGSALDASYPVYDPKYLIESSKEYPISINGKMRTTIDIALGIPEAEVEKIVLDNEVVKKWLEGKPPKKIIYKEGKMVNVVI